MAAIEVVADPAIIEVGAVSKMSAVALDVGGSPVATPVVEWSSSDSRIATVTSEGFASGVFPGVVSIRAATADVIGEAVLTVEERRVVSVAVRPEDLRLAVGTTTILEARALDRNGAEVPGKVFDWSSDNPDTAAVDRNGLLVAVEPGSTRVVARLGELTGTASIEVIAIPVAVVAVVPDPLELVPGERTILVATVLSADHQPLSNREIEWGSDDSSVADVDRGGRVTANSVGDTLIWAEAEGVRGTTRVHVVPGPAASVEIEPWAGPLLIGHSQQLHAVVRAADGTELVERLVSWDTDSHDVAVISSDGMVTGLAPGSVVVTASAEGHEDTLDLEVLVPAERVVVTPESVRLLKGDRTELSVEVLDADGVRLPDRTPVWRTSAPDIALVDDRGNVTAVDAGIARITAALDGREGAATVVVDALRFTAISVGGSASCGLATDGRAYCWGAWPSTSSSAGRRSHFPRPLSDRTDFVGVSMGSSHVCALTSGGSVWCQGPASFGGALGDGTDLGSDVLVQVVGDRTFRHVSAGFSYTCAIDADGAAWCWGRNTQGQLGAGTTTARELVPVPVAGGLTFLHLDTSGAPSFESSSTCGIASDGKAWCWGDGRGGQLGDGILNVTNVPVSVPTTPKFEHVETASLGYWDEDSLAIGHSCACTARGETYCWGSNLHGQLGIGTFDDAPGPVPVAGQFLFTKVSVGGYYVGIGTGGTTCGTTVEGSLFCWGSNQTTSLLGQGTTTSQSATPVQIASGGFVDVAVGRAHACALDVQGRAFCWGDNMSRQAGSPDANVIDFPTLVSGQ